MNIDVLFAGVPVTDFERARAWYTGLFGRPEDIVSHAEEVMWRIDGAAWLYVVRDPERAGRALVALAVADLDLVIAELEGRGITVVEVQAVGAARKAMYLDPDGNTVALIEARAG